MVWKKIPAGDTGTADIFGGDDMNKISDAYSGIDVDDFDINSDIQFRQDKHQIRNSANTFGHKHRSLASAARTITYADTDITVANIPKGPATYLVTKPSTTVFVQDLNGAVVHSGTTVATEIQWALDNLTSGRASKETVKLVGDFTFPTIKLSSFTTLDLTEARIFQTNGTNANFIRNDDLTNGNNNIEIAGGMIDGNKAGQAGGGTEDTQSMVYFFKCTNVMLHHGLYKNGDFHNVRFRDCPGRCSFTNNISLDARHEHVAAHAQGTTPGSCKDYAFINNIFENITAGNTFVSTLNVADISTNNNIMRTVFDGTSTISINGPRNNCIGNIIIAGGYGITLSQIDSPDYDASGSIIADNVIRNCDRYGIALFSHSSAKNILIQNNHIDGNTTSTYSGIFVQGGKNVLIQNNMVHDAQGSGIRLAGPSGFPSDHVLIMNNMCFNNGKSLDGTDDSLRSGIAVDASALSRLTNIIIQGNQCFDQQGTKTQKYGIRTRFSNDCIVRFNDVRNNLTGGFIDVSSSGLLEGGNIGNLTANADTSSGVVGTVETEVNQLKATLRAAGLIG
jgi:parallel beta helix pectate lyase-like protein